MGVRQSGKFVLELPAEKMAGSFCFHPCSLFYRKQVHLNIFKELIKLS